MKCPECGGFLIMVYHDEDEEFTDIQCVECGYLSKKISDFTVSTKQPKESIATVDGGTIIFTNEEEFEKTCKATEELIKHFDKEFGDPRSQVTNVYKEERTVKGEEDGSET